MNNDYKSSDDPCGGALVWAIIGAVVIAMSILILFIGYSIYPFEYKSAYNNPAQIQPSNIIIIAKPEISLNPIHAKKAKTHNSTTCDPREVGCGVTYYHDGVASKD